MRPNAAAVRAYMEATVAVLEEVDPQQVSEMAVALWDLWQRGGTLLVCGNGGSASTATHIACDFAKQTDLARMPPFRVVSIADNVALMTAWANDAGFDRVFAEQVRGLGRAGDALLCISCSGSSANVVEAARAARGLGMTVMAMGGFDGGAMRDLADSYVHVPSRDYGIVESIHLVLDHCLTTMLRQELTLIESSAAKLKPVVLVDRDGVINRNRDDYVKGWSEFEFLPGALAGLAELAAAGHQVVVVTNQSAVGRGVITSAQLAEIHRAMTAEIAAAGGSVAGIYVCEHRPDEGCDCRKPGTALLRKAADELAFSLVDAYLVGDHVSDIEAARAAGCHAVLVRSGRPAPEVFPDGLAPDHVVNDLAAAASVISQADRAPRDGQQARS